MAVAQARDNSIPTADLGGGHGEAGRCSGESLSAQRIARAARGRLPVPGWLSTLAAEAGNGGGVGMRQPANGIPVRPCGIQSPRLAGRASRARFS
jgi:hypothetical protein